MRHLEDNNPPLQAHTLRACADDLIDTLADLRERSDYKAPRELAALPAEWTRAALLLEGTEPGPDPEPTPDAGNAGGVLASVREIMSAAAGAIRATRRNEDAFKRGAMERAAREKFAVAEVEDLLLALEGVAEVLAGGLPAREEIGAWRVRLCDQAHDWPHYAATGHADDLGQAVAKAAEVWRQGPGDLAQIRGIRVQFRPPGAPDSAGWRRITVSGAVTLGDLVASIEAEAARVAPVDVAPRDPAHVLDWSTVAAGHPQDLQAAGAVPDRVPGEIGPRWTARELLTWLEVHKDDRFCLALHTWDRNDAGNGPLQRDDEQHGVRPRALASWLLHDGTYEERDKGGDVHHAITLTHWTHREDCPACAEVRHG